MLNQINKYSFLSVFCCLSVACQTVKAPERVDYLVQSMQESNLKQDLQACSNQQLRTSDFSIAHRGALLKYPEHSRESYIAAAKQGAGFIECDIQVTQDNELVCQHSACDLQETTNILETELSRKCSSGFDKKCCVIDFTLKELQSLKAKNVNQYAEFMSHSESIDLIDSLGLKFIPEIKALSLSSSISAHALVDKVISEFKDKNISSDRVWIQSGDVDIVKEILDSQSEYLENFIWLDYRYSYQPDFVPSYLDFEKIKNSGINNIAPPMFQLLMLDSEQNIIPSEYAKLAKQAGLNLFTWTLERSGHLVKDMKNGVGSKFYYQNILPAIQSDGDTYKVLDVLAKEVEIQGIFSDWPETVTFYANCKGL